MSAIQSNKATSQRTESANRSRLSKRVSSRRNAGKGETEATKEPVSQTYWATEQDEIESNVSLSERLSLCQQHGDFSLAYSTVVQPRLQYFGSTDGYVAFRERWGFKFALGDPVTADSDQRELLASFIEQNNRPSFCQISLKTAQTLSELGYYVNQMGTDTRLVFPDYDCRGKQKEWLRYASNWTARRGYTIAELGIDQIDVDRIETVSEAWRKTRTVKRKEVRFLNRPIILDNETDVRKFYMFDAEGELVAFIFLDPIYKNGNVSGYVTCIKRRHPEAPQYAEHSIMKTIIDTMRQEEVGELRLGLSPLAWIDNPLQPSHWLTSKVFSMGYRSKIINRYFYNVQGHASYKRRFRGNEEATFYAAPPNWNSLRLMALTGLCGIA